MNNKFHITTNGCAVLIHETERLSQYFKANGWIKTDSATDSDITIITCCGVTQNEEDQAIEMIRTLEVSRNKSSIFVVGGCLPGFAKERILKFAPEALILSYQQLDNLDTIIRAHIPLKKIHFNINKNRKAISRHEKSQDEMVAEYVDSQTNGHLCRDQYGFCTMHHYMWQEYDVFQIKVSYGCPGNCTYCATKLGIGSFRSVRKKEVITQYEDGLKRGYKHFLLIGDEIGAYGSDFGETIIDLLQDLYSINSDSKISIRYIHPDILVRYYENLKKYFVNGFVNYFCSAIQSSSPAILKLMGRNPDIEPFIQCMEDMVMKGYPVNRHTQVIVGFPGESSDDFIATLNALIRCDFDHININMYSPRKGTKAYYLKETVSYEQKLCRKEIIKQFMMARKQAKMYEAIKRSILMKEKNG